MRDHRAKQIHGCSIWSTIIFGNETLLALLIDGISAYLLDKFVRRWILIIPLAVISGVVSALLSSYMLHLYDPSMWTAEVAAKRGIVGVFYHPLFVIFFVWLWRKQRLSRTDDDSGSIAGKDDTRTYGSGKGQKDPPSAIYPADEEWEILSKYDVEVSAAVDLVSVHGDAAIKELWKAHRVINDKSQLSRIASRIDKQYRAHIASQKALMAKQKEENTPEVQMKKYDIRSDSGRYYLGDFGYDNLEDAIAYAKRLESRKLSS